MDTNKLQSGTVIEQSTLSTASMLAENMLVLISHSVAPTIMNWNATYFSLTSPPFYNETAGTLFLTDGGSLSEMAAYFTSK